jgi:nucleoside-diphosphate-sugar epimerase
MARKIFSWMNEEYDKVPVERTIMSEPEVPGTVLRLPMVYGPGDPLHRLYPVIKRIVDGRRHIIFSEDLAQWRGCKGYVEDVAHAIVLAATSGGAAGRVYNIAEADALTELDWARLVAKELQWQGEFVVLPRERTPGLRRGGYRAAVLRS